MSGPADAPGRDDDPTPRRIAAEVAVYVALVLVVGGIFVGLRVARDGRRVLDFAPHASR